jgi:hypothetical protein
LEPVLQGAVMGPKINVPSARRGVVTQPAESPPRGRQKDIVKNSSNKLMQTVIRKRYQWVAKHRIELLETFG